MKPLTTIALSVLSAFAQTTVAPPRPVPVKPAPPPKIAAPPQPRVIRQPAPQVVRQPKTPNQQTYKPPKQQTFKAPKAERMPKSAAPENYKMPREFKSAVNRNFAGPRAPSGVPLTRVDVLNNPHRLFTMDVQPRTYHPDIFVRTTVQPPISLTAAQQIALYPPRPGLVCIPGYWLWVDNDFTYIDPTWAAPPTPDAVWIAPQWIAQDDGTWTLTEGYWMDNSDQ